MVEIVYDFKYNHSLIFNENNYFSTRDKFSLIVGILVFNVYPQWCLCCY